MRNNNIFQAAMMAMMMMMAGMNANAQGRGHRGDARSMGGNHGSQREMVMNGNGGFQMRGSQQGADHRGNSGLNNRNHNMENRNPGFDNRNHNMENRNHGMENHNHGFDRRDHQVMASHDRIHLGGHHFDRRWEHHVRHENGRWGYFRDNRWYWYDRYFEPDYYFGRPLASFNPYYYMCDGGYYPGWEGRVRYMDGRWGYLRGSDWYWYDRFYEPDYYYSHPVHHFHRHHCAAGRAVAGVAAGAAGAVILGSLISALCH